MPRHRGTFEESSSEQASGKARKALSNVSLFLALLSVIFFFIRDVLLHGKFDSLPSWLVFGLASIVVVLLFTSSYFGFMYRRHRLPDDTPKLRHVKCSVKGLALDQSLPDQLWPAGGPPPLFAVSKDYEDISLLASKMEFGESFALKSLKWGASSDIVYLSRVATALALAWRENHAEDESLCHHVLTQAGTDAVGAHGWNDDTRSIISVGGSDTNPMSAFIAREYAQGYGGYPPLRFLTGTSETIIARTNQSDKCWFASETEMPWEAPASYGIIFTARAPRPRLSETPVQWAKRVWRDQIGRPVPVRLLLAGLHEIGSQAACDAIIRLIQEEEAPQTYRYCVDDQRSLPFAVVDFFDNPAKAPRVWKVDVRRETGKIAFPLDNDLQLESGPIKTLVVLSRGLRDHSKGDREQLTCAEYLPARGACRLIDFVVQYALKYNAPSVQLDTPASWESELAGDTFLAELMSRYPVLSELILLGTEKQNRWVQKLFKVQVLEDKKKDIEKNLPSNPPGGAIIVHKVPRDTGTPLTITFVFGGEQPNYNDVVTSTQVATLALLKQIRERRLGGLEPFEKIFISKVETYPTDNDIEPWNP